MSTYSPIPLRALNLICGCLAAVLCATPISVSAQAKKNPVSKIYVSDVRGEALIDTGESVEDLSKRSVYTAQGTVIETKKPANESDREKNYSTMVYSNGTGAFFDADTRVEVKRFVQEPFTPNRSDMEVEPSLSQTQAFVSRGTIGLCNSKLVAGSNMTYQTGQGSVNIRAKKLVIEAGSDFTKVSILEGESTVRGGNQDMGGHNLKAGEQAIIRKGLNGQPNQVQIQPIPASEMKPLDDKVTMACMAKKTVYFDVQERTVSGSNQQAPAETSGTDTKAGASNDGDSTGGRVTAFDGTTSGASSVTVREIVPVEIIPATLPTQYTVSPASLVTPGP
jgi:hypothetical protein